MGQISGDAESSRFPAATSQVVMRNLEGASFEAAVTGEFGSMRAE
jgi:hypothetical protein